MRNIKIKLSLKIRDIQKIKKNNCIHISAFDCENKGKTSNLRFKKYFYKACGLIKLGSH